LTIEEWTKKEKLKTKWEALELGLGRFSDREADEEVLEQGRDGCGLLSSLDSGLTIEVVIHADGDVFHAIGMFSPFHSLSKRGMLCPFAAPGFTHQNLWVRRAFLTNQTRNGKGMGAME